MDRRVCIALHFNIGMVAGTVWPGSCNNEHSLTETTERKAESNKGPAAFAKRTSALPADFAGEHGSDEPTKPDASGSGNSPELINQDRSL